MSDTTDFGLFGQAAKDREAAEALFAAIMQQLGDSHLAHFGNGKTKAAFVARDVEAAIRQALCLPINHQPLTINH